MGCWRVPSDCSDDASGAGKWPGNDHTFFLKHPVDRMEQEVQESDVAFYIIAFFLCTIILIICAVSFIIASILILGARTGRPSYFIPWLFMTALFMMFHLVYVIIMIITQDWEKVFSNLAGLVLEVYVFLCVNSFMRQLRGGDDKPCNKSNNNQPN